MTVTIKLTENQQATIISMVMDHLKMADEDEAPELEALLEVVSADVEVESDD